MFFGQIADCLLPFADCRSLLQITCKLKSCGWIIGAASFFEDGSYNGLQHYATLGRDKFGAATVNLVAGGKPADVYLGIAARVLDIMKRDAAKDPTDPNVKRTRMLINQVDRKLFKQTVMKLVYGVTYIGAPDQIKKRLHEHGAIEDDGECFACYCYASKTTLLPWENCSRLQKV